MALPFDPADYAEVLAYSRFSSQSQAAGTSESRQADALAALAAEGGFSYRTEAVDRGRSGFTGDNLAADAAMGQLLALLESDPTTRRLLVLERQDRFGRLSTLEALTTLFQRVLAKGCDIYYLGSGRLITRAQLDDFGVLVTLAAEMHAAHQHSALIAERCRVAHRKGQERVRRGEAVRAGLAPSWIRLGASGWELTPYAEVVRRVVELCESGLGSHRIATLLQKEGVPPPKGKAWRPPMVLHLLASPALAGGRTIGRRKTAEIVWGYWPAVIERPRFEALQRLIHSRLGDASLRGDQTTILWVGQGCTVCAACGAAMGARQGGERRNGRRVPRLYLRCRGRTNGTCKAPSLPLASAASHLLTRLRSAQLAELFPAQQDERVAALGRTVDTLRRRLAEARAMAAAAERQIAQSLLEEPAAAAVLARSVAAAEGQAAEIEADLLAAQHQLETAQQRQQGEERGDLADRAQELLRSFSRGADTPEQRRRVNTLLRRLGFSIAVDTAGERIGLRVGDGPIDWRPLAPTARAIALAAGFVDPAVGEVIDKEGNHLVRVHHRGPVTPALEAAAAAVQAELEEQGWQDVSAELGAVGHVDELLASYQARGLLDGLTAGEIEELRDGVMDAVVERLRAEARRPRPSRRAARQRRPAASTGPAGGRPEPPAAA